MPLASPAPLLQAEAEVEAEVEAEAEAEAGIQEVPVADVGEVARV